MTQNPHDHPILLQEKPWAENDNDIWIASTIQFLRNMDKFKFPSKMETSRAKQVIDLVSKEISRDVSLSNPLMFRAEELGPLEKEFLMEHFLSLENFQQTHIGEGFIIDATGEFLLSVNIQNHFNLQITDTRNDVENAWNRLVKIETQLGKIFNYAYSSRYGFLTANPFQSGTGMLLTLFIQPSALIHTNKINEILKKLDDDTISVAGIQGNPNVFIGDIIAIHNKYTLGITEEGIIASLSTFANKLIAEEKIEREHLKKEECPNLKDQVSRAYGLIVYSYQTETLEALEAISLLKLGLSFGWISGITVKELNQLFFNCRRAHLVRRFKEEFSGETLLHKRAEFVHENLKNIKLEI